MATHPDYTNIPETSSHLLALAAERGVRYLEQLSEQRVFPATEELARLPELGGALPETPQSPEEVIALLDEIGSPATVASAGARFFGFVIGGALPVSVAANWLATAWDQNAGLYATSPAAAEIEQIALDWLLDVLGLPTDAAGAFVTGATMANFTALAAARYALLQRVGWDVDADGLFGAPPITVVVGAEAHTTLFKALSMLGLGRKRVVTVPVDGQGRIRADALPEGITGPVIVCIQAGNVNTGAFDPAGEILPWARRLGAWVHVDGAFGLWAAAASARSAQVAEFTAADSWATDAHKFLNTPYDSGLAFVRDAAALRAAMVATAAYLPTATRRDESNYTPELSRRARGVEVWAALRTLGRAGLADLVERCCRHATRFAEGLRAAGFEILNEVTLNQVLVSFGDAEQTRQVIAAIQDDGTCWCGGTVWQGHIAMRISVSSWATTDEDVERSLAAMIRAAHDTLT